MQTRNCNERGLMSRESLGSHILFITVSTVGRHRPFNQYANLRWLIVWPRSAGNARKLVAWATEQTQNGCPRLLSSQSRPVSLHGVPEGPRGPASRIKQLSTSGDITYPTARYPSQFHACSLVIKRRSSGLKVVQGHNVTTWLTPALQ